MWAARVIGTIHYFLWAAGVIANNISSRIRHYMDSCVIGKIHFLEPGVMRATGVIGTIHSLEPVVMWAAGDIANNTSSRIRHYIDS